MSETNWAEGVSPGKAAEIDRLTRINHKAKQAARLQEIEAKRIEREEAIERKNAAVLEQAKELASKERQHRAERARSIAEVGEDTLKHLEGQGPHAAA